MAAPYTSVSVSGYNDNPPPDDGTESEENRILWETIKEKLPDPLKTALEAINTNIGTAFGKVVGGAGVVSSAISATVGATDQGKLYRATGSGITITTPDATSVTSPFVFGFLNSSTGTVTLDGNGSQTINGAASITVPVGGGGVVWTDGSNWFIAGLGGVLAGKQLGYGDIINGTIAESNSSNAVTFALKTLAGNNPSTDDPVLICFRNATAGTGNYVYQTVTAALSITIPSTATMGAANATPFDLAIALFDDAGTIRIGAINPFAPSTLTFHDLQLIATNATATAVDTGADSAKTWYANAAVPGRAFAIIAIARYASGLATAGVWNVSPTIIQPFARGIALPGYERPKLLHVRDEKAGNTAGGTFTAGAWQTRTLNTVVVNEISGASVASNQITLPAGIYEIDARAPANVVGAHKAKLINITDTADIILGSSESAGTAAATTTWSEVKGRFQLAAEKVLELQHRCTTTAANGFGVAANFGTEVYSEVIIRKIG